MHEGRGEGVVVLDEGIAIGELLKGDGVGMKHIRR